MTETKFPNEKKKETFHVSDDRKSVLEAINGFSAETSVGDETILRETCRTLLGITVFDKGEEYAFIRCFRKFVILFDRTLDKLKDLSTTEKNISSDIACSLNYLVTITEIAISIVQHVSSLKDNSSEVIGSLSESLLNMLFSSYGHCLNSEDIFGRLSEDICESISLLYQNSRQLLMDVITFLDRACETEIAFNTEHLLSICKRLFDLSCLVQSVDVKVMADLWKVYTKLLTHNLSMLLQTLDITPVIRHLSKEVRIAVDSICSLRKSSKVIEKCQVSKKALKLSGFNMKLIVTFCDKFSGHLSDCVYDAVELVLFLFGLTSPVHGGSFVELFQSITVGIEPLTVALLGEREFKRTLVTAGQKTPYPLCLLLILVMNKLPTLDEEALDLWMCHGPSILEVLFDAFALCTVECLLPAHLHSVMCHGKPQRQVTLHEHVCTRTCVFVASLPAKYFYNLERLLLVATFSSKWLMVCLALDVWCFIARLSTSELCLSHCCLLAQIISSHSLLQKPPLHVIHLRILLQRLIHYLSSTHRDVLRKKFSPVVDVPCLLLPESGTKLDENTLYKLFRQMPSLCLQLKKGDTSLATATTLHFLSSFCLQLPAICQLNFYAGNRITIYIFRAIGLTINLYMDDHMLVQVLNVLLDPSIVECQLRHLCFIAISEPLSCIQFHPSSFQSQIVSLLARNFALSLQVEDVVLRQTSFRVFALFARLTPHTDLLSMVFRSCPMAQQDITNFFQKQIPKDFLCEVSLLFQLRDITNAVCGAKKCIPGRDEELRSVKRQKRSNFEENTVLQSQDSFLEHVLQLESTVNQLEALVGNSGVPFECARQRLQACVFQLQKMLSLST